MRTRPRATAVLLALATAGTIVAIVAVGALELFARVYLRAPAVLWEPDPVVGTRLVPGAVGRWQSPDYDVAVRINSNGFRDVERGETAPEGAQRIVV